MFFIFLTQRREFINGEAEPTDAEAEWHSENEEEEKLAVSTSLGNELQIYRIVSINSCTVRSIERLIFWK